MNKNAINNIIIFSIISVTFPCLSMEKPDPFLHIRDKIISEFMQRKPFSHLKAILLQKTIKENKTFYGLSFLKAKQPIINSIAIDSNSKFLAIGANYHNIIILVDLSSKSESIIYFDKNLKPESDIFKRLLDAPEKGKAYVGFINNNVIYNNDTNNTINVYDLKTKQNIKTVATYNTINSLVTNQKDYAVAINNNTLLINGEKIDWPESIEGINIKLAFSNNILTGAKFDAYVYNIETKQLSIIKSPLRDGFIYSLSLSPNATMIGFNNVIYNLNNSSVINKDEKRKDQIYANAFHPNNKIFSYRTRKNEIIFNNINTNEKFTLTLKKIDSGITHMLYSPDGKMLIIGLGNGEIKLFETSNLSNIISYMNSLKDETVEFIDYLTKKNPQDQLPPKYAQFLFLNLVNEAIEKKEVINLLGKENKWLQVAYDSLPEFVKTAIEDYVSKKKSP